VSDEQNAAVAIRLLDDALSTFDQQLAQATATTETHSEYDAASIEVAKGFLREHPDIVARLHDASNLPAYEPNYDFANGPTSLMDSVLMQTGEARRVARVLYGHGLMSLAQAETDQAALDAIAIVNWSQYVSKQPLLVNYLVGAAIFDQATDVAARCLYAGDLSPELRARLLVAIRDASFGKVFGRAIDSERAFGISSFDSFPMSRFHYMLGELSAYLDLVEEFEQCAAKPSGLAPNMPTTKSIFGGLVWPSLDSALRALRRSQAKSRAVQILAVWQDRDANATAKLDELGLADAVTTDPFDGSQMKLITTADSIAIYSVGSDLEDNEGNLEDEQDVGVGPVETSGH